MCQNFSHFSLLLFLHHFIMEKNSHQQHQQTSYSIRPIKRTFSEVRVLAIFCFTAPLNDCRSERISRYCTFALSLFNLLRRSRHAKRTFIGQLYAHAANMNSESAKELLKWRNSVLVCIHGKRERYVILLFLLLLGGSFTHFS